MVFSWMFPLCVITRVTVWNNSVSHTNDVLQARVNVKNIKYKDVYGLHKAFALAITGVSGQIHADFLWFLWVLADKQL